MISEEKIAEIIDKTDMVSLVSEHVQLQKRGKNYFGLCDQSPSFSVSPEKKIAKCMSCGEGGNPINFLKKIKNITFEEAAYILAERVGVHVERTKTTKIVDVNSKYYEINQIAQQFYQHYLHNSQTGKEALLYLNKRGLSLETIKMFGIGLAPKDHTTLVKVLTDKGYSLTDASDIGLVKNNKEGYYDAFYNRIMFPIVDDNNHILGFSGRIFYDDPAQPKYVNTEETVIYKKGEMLYNLNNALPHIRKQGRVILCEGQMDVIALSNNGIKEVVCSLGTALTKEQAKLLAKYTKNVIICYDGDNAGIKATGKAFNVLTGFNTTSVTLPNGMDPDEFLKKNSKDDFINFLKDNQRDVYSFVYHNAFRNRNLSVAYDYEEVKKSVFSFLSKTNSTALIEKYLHQLAIDLKVSYDAIYNDYNIYCRGGSIGKPVENFEEDKNIIKPIKAHEKMLLCFVMWDKKYFDFFERELPNFSDYIESPVVFDIYNVVAYYYNCLDCSKVNIFNYCYGETKNSLIQDVMNQVIELVNYPYEKVEKMLNDCIERFHTSKFIQKRNEFEVKSVDATEDIQKIMNEKLAFVRSNVKIRK